MKYLVHLFPVVKLPGWVIEAGNHQRAIEQAQRIWDTAKDKQRQIEDFGQYADEISCFLVDEIGDEEHENSRYYDELGHPIGQGRVTIGRGL